MIQSTVRRRRVLYIPGFDPMPPRRYRELYRREGAKQAEISGYSLAQTGSGGDPFSWGVETKTEGQPVSARVEVLAWADIVQDSMDRGILGTYWQLLKTAWIYLSTGTLRRLMWLRKGPIIAALYPVVMLVGQFFLAWAAGALAGGLLNRGITAALTFVFGGPGWFGALLGNAVGWAVMLALMVVVLRGFRALDGRLFAYYLMHDYAFSAGLSGEDRPELIERRAAFADKVADALADDVDEVLVVGHSSGAQIAVSLVADLLRAGRVPANGPVLSLLTLGQAIPMVSFLPWARRLRADLNLLAGSDAITWIDVSAPGDGCAFALCDPVAVTGVTPERQRWPIVLSAAFTQTMSPETWRQLRWRFFRLHFQYLCAFDKPGAYDYFQLTAGPKTLAERFGDRPSSTNRIDVAASRYTSMAA